jgi:hypothetical protein
MYRTGSVVIVYIVWLYFTLVVFMISFSIVSSCLFRSLLFVWVGIVYERAGSGINAINFFFDGGHISFDTSHVMYINNVLGAFFQMFVELEEIEDNHTW